MFLNRTNASEYQVIFSKKSIEPKSYRIKTAVKVGPSTKRNSYSGIVINASSEGKEMVAIEINGKQEYRIRKISSRSKFLSGTESNQGWVKSNNINKNEVYNYIDVISNKGKCDLFINSKYQATVEVPERTNGSFGFIIGPNSQARVDYIIAYLEDKKATNTGLKNLESKIDKLNYTTEKISKLEKENIILRQQTVKKEDLEKEKKIVQENIKTIARLETEKKALNEKLKRIALLEKENERLKAKYGDYSDLKKENTALNQKIGLLSKVEAENKQL